MLAYETRKFRGRVSRIDESRHSVNVSIMSVLFLLSISPWLSGESFFLLLFFFFHLEVQKPCQKVFLSNYF